MTPDLVRFRFAPEAPSSVVEAALAEVPRAIRAAIAEQARRVERVPYRCAG